MHISILSMQRVVNFGSVLQAYSMRRILKELTDADVTFLDIDSETLPSQKRIRETDDYQTPAAYPPGVLQKGKRWLITRLSRINKAKIRAFMEKELRLNESAPCNPDYVIVGSDEVFNHAEGVRLQLHGKIPQAEKCFTYGASCGSAVVEDISPADLPAVREAMANFSAVSVRDRATESYADALYQGKVYRHLDPVLVGDLGNRNHKSVPFGKYLLVYAYGQRIRTQEEIGAIQAFAKAKKLKTVAIGGSQFWCDYYVPVSPFRMLDYFYHARYVVTDTFHGAIFSVLHKKQFAVILRKTNRNKLTGLLEDLELTDRVAEDMNRLEEILNKPINYEKTEEILQRERVRTRAYLKKQLGV